MIKKLTDLKAAEYNPRRITDASLDGLKYSLKEFGDISGIVFNEKTGNLVAGHQRVKALLSEHGDLDIQDGEIVTPNGERFAVRVVFWELEKEKAANVAANSPTISGQFTPDLFPLLGEIKFEMPESFNNMNFKELLGIDVGKEDPDLSGLDEGLPEPPQTPIVKRGDIFRLGRHRVMCGDSTGGRDLDALMGGKAADLGFNDPPYGMKKEKDGVENDNLNYEDLLAFNNQWMPLQFSRLKANGSFYCWGTDEPLMDVYSGIIKPLAKRGGVTFRNIITWDKGSGQGQNSSLTRMYAIADEKCLFVMMGVQGFNTNKDNYFDGWEPIRSYLVGQRDAMGWSASDVVRITGKTTATHYFSTSQWVLPTREHYESLRSAAAGGDAFKKEYDEIKKEYDEIKAQYYDTRAYFDNEHDNFNNVWSFPRDVQNTLHATPKPIALCTRAIKTSCPPDGSVLDAFLGSGSTLIAADKLNRTCYGMEISPNYVEVCIRRFAENCSDENGNVDFEHVNGDLTLEEIVNNVNTETQLEPNTD